MCHASPRSHSPKGGGIRPKLMQMPKILGKAPLRGKNWQRQPEKNYSGDLGGRRSLRVAPEPLSGAGAQRFQLRSTTARESRLFSHSRARPLTDSAQHLNFGTLTSEASQLMRPRAAHLLTFQGISPLSVLALRICHRSLAILQGGVFPRVSPSSPCIITISFRFP